MRSFQFGWLQTSRTAYHMFIIKCNLIYLSLVSSHRPIHGWLLSFSILGFGSHLISNMCAMLGRKRSNRHHQLAVLFYTFEFHVTGVAI